MVYVRRFFLVFTLILFFVLLLNLAADYAIVRLVGQPSSVKRVISDSGLYDNAVNSVLAQVKTVSAGKDKVPLQDDLFKNVAQQAFPPAYLQRSVETVIDGLYHWLDGRVKLPDFKLDIAEAKQKLVDSLAIQLKNRLAKLPVCPANISLDNYDAFSAKCRPANLDPAAFSQQLKKQLLTSRDFLPDKTLTANDIKLGDQKADVFRDQLKNVPKIYQNFKRSPLVFILLILLVATAAVMLAASRQGGLRKVSLGLLIAGLVIVGASITLSKSLLPNDIRRIKLDSPALTKNVRDVVKTLVDEINGEFRAAGLAYTIGGGLAFGGLVVYQRRRPDA